MDYQLSITIDRPPHEVFDYVTDPANIPRWAPYVQEAIYSPPGTVGIGTQMNQTVRGRQVTWTVTAWKPGWMCTYEADYWYASNAKVTFRVESAGEVTRLSVHDRGERTGFMRLLAPILDRLDERIRRGQLETIKTVLENRPPPA